MITRMYLSSVRKQIIEMFKSVNGVIYKKFIGHCIFEIFHKEYTLLYHYAANEILKRVKTTVSGIDIRTPCLLRFSIRSVFKLTNDRLIRSLRFLSMIGFFIWGKGKWLNCLFTPYYAITWLPVCWYVHCWNVSVFLRPSRRSDQTLL